MPSNSNSNSNQDQFHANVSTWAKTNPQAAVFLPYVDCKHLTFCKSTQGTPNLIIKLSGQIRYFHSESDPVLESFEWFSSLPLKDVTILYIYGVGLGYDYLAAKNWLESDKNRRLVFLEDDLAVIHRLFETDLGTEILNQGQVTVFYFDDLKKASDSISELFWVSMTLNIHIEALRFYAEQRSELFDELKHKLAYDATLYDSTVKEYLAFGLAFFQNFYPNMLLLKGAYLGNALKGKFKGIPAIICGAGPSLDKQLSKLSTLQERALIFAGGSAVNSLNAADFQPHFGAGIDPNPAQYDRLVGNTAFEVPFFYRNRMYHQAFKMIHGPHLYIPGSGGYDVSEFFEEKFDIKTEEFDEGFNVVNFCMEIARFMGCSPIILVGLDLAFTDMKSYSMGIQDNVNVKEQDILNAGDLDSNAILKKDIYDKPLYTLWKWIAESQWISDFNEASPGLVINATEGGLGMKGIPNETFDSVIKTHLKQEYDLSNRVHGEIQNSALIQVTEEKLTSAMEELRDSLIHCKENFEIMIEESTKIVQKILQEQKLPKIIQSGKAALCEIELEEEPGYIYVLNIFNLVYSKILNRELQHLNSLDIPDWKKVATRLDINNKKLNFLKKGAVVHIELINNTLYPNA